MMRKIWLFVTMFSLVAIAARAQEVPSTPKAELYGSYSYMRFGGLGFQATNLDKGFDAAGVYNVNHWLGFVGDIGGHWGHYPINLSSGGTANIKASIHSALIGPRFSYRKNDKVTPFVNILIGGSQIYRGYTPPGGSPAPAPTAPAPSPAPSTPPPAPTAPAPSPATPTSPAPTTPGGGATSVVYPTTSASGTPGYIHKTDMAFTMGVGGGFDVKLSDRVAFRPFEAEYLMMRPNGTNINNLRLSTGISFRFGAK